MGAKSRRSLATALLAATAALPIVISETAIAGEETVAVRLPVDRAAESQVATVTVHQGDHLWRIARRRLEEVMGRGVTSGQIARYWRSLIDHNVDRLRSGDPDLIYPGEVIVLPVGPVSGQP